MNRIITVILMLVIVTTFSGCVREDIGPATVWRNGILVEVSVDDISTITVHYSWSDRNFSYIFTERLDILNELTIGEYYEFGIYGKRDDRYRYIVNKLVEIYDANETLIWTCL